MLRPKISNSLTVQAMNDNGLMEIYRRLLERFGPQHWWPGETTLEIIVGAILTQNTNWTNVEKAIVNLKRTERLSIDAIHHLSQDELAELIRPAGYYNIKARRLKNFMDWLFETYRGDLSVLEEQHESGLREQLLAINGIGPETADSILLYAFGKPVFVVDAYTCRILGRHRFLEPPVEYEQVRDLLEASLPRDVALYNEFHALFVRLGKEFCKTRPHCQGCPLENLPHDVEIMEE